MLVLSYTRTRWWKTLKFSIFGVSDVGFRISKMDAYPAPLPDVLELDHRFFQVVLVFIDESGSDASSMLFCYIAGCVTQ